VQSRRRVGFTKGRIIVRGTLVTRGTAKRPDYILYYQHIQKGVVNLLPVDRIHEHEGVRPPGSSRFCGGGGAREVLPAVASLRQLVTAYGSGEKVTSWAEVLGDGTLGREAARGMTWCLAPLQAPFALARRLVGGLGTLGHRAVLPRL
jgi:hypothetical protein